MACHSHILAPLTDLLSKKHRKFVWDDACTAAFKCMCALVASDAILAYPNHNLPLDSIKTDTSNFQLGAIIKQKQCPVAYYYTRKLSMAQRNYTTIEKELLSIIETLWEFRTMLLVARLRIYTDHCNLTHSLTSFTTQQVMATTTWRIRSYLHLSSRQSKYHCQCSFLSPYPINSTTVTKYNSRTTFQQFCQFYGRRPRGDAYTWRVTRRSLTEWTFTKTITSRRCLSWVSTFWQLQPTALSFFHHWNISATRRKATRTTPSQHQTLFYTTTWFHNTHLLFSYYPLPNTPTIGALQSHQPCCNLWSSGITPLWHTLKAWTISKLALSSPWSPIRRQRNNPEHQRSQIFKFAAQNRIF